jgi:hypothetical protein
VKKPFLSLLMISSSLVSAQELHTFSNGEVADAAKINENFEIHNNLISSLQDQNNTPTAADLDIVIGGEDFIWSGLGQYEVKDGVYTYHFSNVTYYDREGNELARGQVTSRYDNNNLATLPDQQVCATMEASLAMYRASGFVLLGTPLTTQQVSQDPTHPDASYSCNGINTLVLVPLVAEGDMVCASGRNKSINQAGDNFGQLNGNIPTMAQGNFDGSTPSVSEGEIIIPKQTDC